MKYTLTVLTNGRLVYFERMLAAFVEHVEPKPEWIYVFDDGGATMAAGSTALTALLDGTGVGYSYEAAGPLGQCRAQAHCWSWAAGSEHDYVFHIEDDLVILRPTDLRDLMTVLEDESESERVRLVQMALVRCPWGAEIEHGGYIAQTPGWYERHEAGYADWNAEWIETTRNWAHAPALFRTDLCREFPFPAEPGCETTIGPQIIERYPDAVFGLWGWGEPWCAHIGVERAKGAHGY